MRHPRDEESRLLMESKKSDSACYTAVVLALNTAMRRDELRKLQLSQLDWANRAITVGKSKTEAGRGRIIPLSPGAFKTMLEWKAKFLDGKPEHSIFSFCEHNQVDSTRPRRDGGSYRLKGAGG